MMDGFKMNGFTVKQFQKPESYKDFTSYVLGVDIGGTNTNIAIAGIKNQKPVLLFSLNFKSKEITSINYAINESLKYTKNTHDIDVNYGCIGAAGVVSKNNNFASLTNVPWNVDCKDIIKKTSISDIFVVNDFQIIGYGINHLDSSNQNNLIEIKKSITIDDCHLTKAIIGAGTGLGKCILSYDEELSSYVPLPSEGGSVDLPVYNDLEYEMMRHIQKKYRHTFPVTYEQVLSGVGLCNIYDFLKKTDRYKDKNIISVNTADDISRYKSQDDCCHETFEIFIRFYARSIKNFILDTMALGGVYIAGGIAMKNLNLFNSKMFKDEIENTFQMEELLRNVPIFLVNNYDVSLLGACFAANQKKLKI